MELVLLNSQMNQQIPQSTYLEMVGNKIALDITQNFTCGKVVVIAGNNPKGKIGFVVAKILKENHFDVTCNPTCLTTQSFTYIIDALQEDDVQRITWMNKQKGIKIALVIPTGLSLDTGLGKKNVFQADYTYVIQNYRLGHLCNDGKECCGKLRKITLDIENLMKDTAFIMQKKEIASYFPPRKSNTNKGHYGKVCIIGGSKQYIGAPLLSLKAALRLGAGYVTLAIPEELFSLYGTVEPSALKISLPSKEGKFIFNPLQSLQLKEIITKNNSIVLGMGMGVSYENYQMISFILKNFSGKLLIDADGINCLSRYGIDILKEKKCAVILTPHIVEFARLMQVEPLVLLKNTFPLLQSFSAQYDTCVLLKNNVTFCCYQEQRFLSIAGNAGLAKAGSGDVLSGIIGSLLSYMPNSLAEVGIIGANLLGMSAELLEDTYCRYALDYINEIPHVFAELKKEVEFNGK